MKFKYIFVILLISIGFGNYSFDESLSVLMDDNDWKLIKNFPDGINLYEKNIDPYDLKAYRIETITEISKDKLLQAFENVQIYPDILTSAKNVTFDVISENNEVIQAYQHIRIPLLADRHYFYKMYKHKNIKNYSWWQLTDVDKLTEKNLLIENNLPIKAVRLQKGIGLYKVDSLENSNRVHYSLYMDPEGNIPDFLANMVNRSGIINMFRDLLKYSAEN